MTLKMRLFVSMVVVFGLIAGTVQAPVQAQVAANVNVDPEGDTFDLPNVPFPYPAFLDILESSVQLTGDPGDETLVFRMIVAAPIDLSALPAGAGADSAPPKGLQHPGVISGVFWRFPLDTDPLAFHAGFPNPPGVPRNPNEYALQLHWLEGQLRTELWTSGVGSVEDVMAYTLSEVDGRGVIELALPVSLIGGMSSLDDLAWFSATAVGFGSPCTPGICLMHLADRNEPVLDFELSQ
jgi:hypothetical protein